jgi:hypothetical protein
MIEKATENSLGPFAFATVITMTMVATAVEAKDKLSSSGIYSY